MIEDYKELASSEYLYLCAQLRAKKGRGTTYTQRQAATVLLRRMPDGCEQPRAFGAWIAQNRAAVALLVKEKTA